MLEFYSGAAGLSGRFTEGFFHRRSHPALIFLAIFSCADFETSRLGFSERRMSIYRYGTSAAEPVGIELTTFSATDPRRPPGGRPA